MKYAPFNRFEIAMPEEAVLDCAHQGPCDEDVAYWAPRISREGIDPDDVREELLETGGWDREELQDDETNWQRLIWIAAGNIKDNWNDSK